MVLDFVKALLLHGADVNSVAMRREDSERKVRDMMRFYLNEPEKRFKVLPHEKLSFFVFQTPLSLAIQANNSKLVRLLAKHKADMELCTVIYPRMNGIEYHPPREPKEEDCLKVAADFRSVPTVYSLLSTYQKVSEFDTAYHEWKYLLDNEVMFDRVSQ